MLHKLLLYYCLLSWCLINVSRTLFYWGLVVYKPPHSVRGTNVERHSVILSDTHNCLSYSCLQVKHPFLLPFFIQSLQTPLITKDILLATKPSGRSKVGMDVCERQKER